MEVTCERCKAEYDFDDSLVGESGTSVKCTDCGHVFKVYPQGAGSGRGRLQLRFRDGHVELLSSLRELQRRARDGEVTLQDEIGREGFEWRPLHTVPELRGFFEGSGRPASAATKPLGAGRLAVTPSLWPEEARSAAPPAAAKQTMVGIGPQGIPAQIPRPAPLPVDDAVTRVAQRDPAPGSPVPPSQAGASAPKRPSSPAPPPPAKTPSPSQPSPKLYLADDDAAEAPAARRSVGSGSMRWVGLAVLVAGGIWFGVNALSGGGFTANEGDANGDEGDAEEAAAAPTLEANQAPDGAVGAADSTEQAGDEPTVEPLTEERAARDKPQAEKPAAKKAPKPDKPAKRTKPTRAKKAEREEASRSAKHEQARHEDEDEGGADYGSLVGRASRAVDQGEFATAEALFRRALEQRGSGSEANSGMGFALLGQGKAGAAVPYFQTAARNGFAAASVGLGDAYAKQGRKADAIEAYESYLKRLPNGSRAGYARSRIEALGPAKAEKPTPEKAAEPSAAPEPNEPAEPAPTPAGVEEEEEEDDYVPAGALSEDGL